MTHSKLAGRLRKLLSSDPFGRLRTDQELGRLVTDTAQNTRKPYSELLAQLVGAAPGTTEEHARAFWQQAVAHRRAMATALGRSVHLRVAVLDLLMRTPRTDLTPLIVSKPTLTHLFQAATHDSLTGLANKEHFLTLLQHQLLQRSAKPVVVAYLDLDGFKQVNDVFGHATGDEVLVRFSAALSGVARRGDVLARVGGDEFAALFVDAGTALVRQILARLEQPMRPLFQRYGVGVSNGLASAQKGETAEALLDRADQAMYSHKRSRPKRPAVEVEVEIDLDLDSEAPPRPSPVALYATRKADRLLSVHSAFAEWGCVLLPVASLKSVEALSSLLSPQVVLADVLFPPKGGQAVLSLATRGRAVSVALVAPSRMWSLSQGLDSPVISFPLQGDQLERVLKGVRRANELPRLADEAEAKALAAAVVALLNGTRLNEATLRAVGARPEIDLVRRHLGA